MNGRRVLIVAVSKCSCELTAPVERATATRREQFCPRGATPRSIVREQVSVISMSNATSRSPLDSGRQSSMNRARERLSGKWNDKSATCCHKPPEFPIYE